MHIEFEAKFLDVDIHALRQKLKAAGAIMVYAERFMKRKVFDYPDKRLEKIGGWIRVRDEGDKVTLSYKRLFDRSIEGIKEITVEVSNFDDICSLFLAVGFEERSYQETRREQWNLNDVEITIDTWPWIPAFMEIEAKNAEKVKETATTLDFRWEDAMHGSVETAYQKYFDVTEESVDNWERIEFVPVPDWLEARRKGSK